MVESDTLAARRSKLWECHPKESPHIARLPETQQQRQRRHRCHAAGDVGERWPQKLEIRNCTLAKVPPQTSTAGHTPRKPRQPDIVQTIQAGTISENNGNLPAGHRRELHFRQAGHFGERDDRRAERAERHRCRVGDQRQSGGVERREAGADQQRGRDGHRRAKPGGPFDERAEAKRDQQRLNALIGRQRNDRSLDDLKLSRLDREHVQEHRGQHDPADRKQAEAGAVTGRRDRRLPRHAEDADRHGERRNEAGRRRLRRRPTQQTQRTQQHHDRRRRQQRRENLGAGRVVLLGPGHSVHHRRELFSRRRQGSRRPPRKCYKIAAR